MMFLSLHLLLLRKPLNGIFALSNFCASGFAASAIFAVVTLASAIDLCCCYSIGCDISG
jgi:hypothetical protein